MEMVTGLLEAATKTFEGTSCGGIGAGDAVATVGGAMDDVTARRDAARSAKLEIGPTSTPSLLRRSSQVARLATLNLASLVRKPAERFHISVPGSNGAVPPGGPAGGRRGASSGPAGRRRDASGGPGSRVSSRQTGGCGSSRRTGGRSASGGHGGPGRTRAADQARPARWRGRVAAMGMGGVGRSGGVMGEVKG